MADYAVDHDGKRGRWWVLLLDDPETDGFDVVVAEFDAREPKAEQGARDYCRHLNGSECQKLPNFLELLFGEEIKVGS